MPIVRMIEIKGKWHHPQIPPDHTLCGIEVEGAKWLTITPDNDQVIAIKRDTCKECLGISGVWDKEIPVQVEWSGIDIKITTEDGQNLEFIEGHCVDVIYAKFQGEQRTVVTEKPWLMSGKGKVLDE